MKIGAFAHLGQVSIRMLRHYDALGLLKPTFIDPETGYRHYSARQLPLLRRLRTLRDLGFALDDIRELLDDGVPHEISLARLRQRRDEQQERAAQEHSRLHRLDAYLRAIENEDTMTHTSDIQIKALPAQRVASLRDAALVRQNDEGGQDMSVMWQLLHERLPSALREPDSAVLWHEGEREGLPEPELVHPLAEGQNAPAPFQTKTLAPVEQAAALTYHGHYADEEMAEAFRTLHRWAEMNGFRVTGATRQVFHGGELVDGREQMRIDLQVPVTR